MTGPHIGDDRERGRDELLLGELPAPMREGIEEWRTGSAVPDDPAELEARLSALRARVMQAAGVPAGGWRTVGREQAARQLTEHGFDLDTARRMVTDYLREVSERVGASAYQWGLDQGDIAAIARTTGQHSATTADTVEAADTDVVGDGGADEDGDAAEWSR